MLFGYLLIMNILEQLFSVIIYVFLLIIDELCIKLYFLENFDMVCSLQFLYIPFIDIYVCICVLCYWKNG